MDCSRVLLSGHAVRRIFARRLAQADILEVVRTGETIENYPHDTPFPSRLLLGAPGGAPLHVVVAQNDATGDCFVVTAYRPDPGRWSPDFRTRRPP